MIPWNEMSEAAWKVRENSFIFGNTKVGAATFSENSSIHTGCNIQQVYRSHDIHAEVNAISNMIACGDRKLIAILIVAKREFFTPCGSCMDWIMQFGGDQCVIGFQNNRDGEISTFTAKELMPHYPR